MKKLTLEETHAVLLEVLSELDRATKEIGVRYWLACGTALGAVRHKGFIPWDDDIDVYMLRGDYEKFCSEYQDSDAFRLYTYKRNPGYPYGYAKLSNTRTTFLQDVVALDCGMGAFIDVFPLDYVGGADAPDVPALQKGLRLVKLYWYAEILKHNKNNLRRQGLPKWLVSAFVHGVTRPAGRGRLLEAVERQHRSFPEESSGYCMLYWGKSGVRDCVPKEWTEQTAYLEFEGREYPVFASWDAYLSQMYGDYMTPPENPQPPHGQYFE